MTPAWLLDAVESYGTGELTTLSRGGPSTFPVATALDRERGLIITTSSVSYPAKINNIRRDPRIGLFYGFAQSSKIEEPPTIHLQGTALIRDESFEENMRVVGQFPRLVSGHPSLMRRLRQPRWRKLYQPYMTRVLIEITPERAIVRRSGHSSPEAIEWG